MQIKRMEEYHLENIIKIDQLAFERVEPRSLENLHGLRSLDPDGCFILTEGDEIVGYCFSKTMGSEGYLGPVGIHPPYQGNGMGQKLIQPSMEYLKSRCQVIGLEVRPEAGENMGLYHKLGFHSTFPSLILEVPETIEVKLEGPNDYGVDIYSEMSQARKELFLEKFDLWTRQELMGISYRDDLELTHAGGGHIIIVSQAEEPMGVIASYHGVFLHLWGGGDETSPLSKRRS